jgi:putative resolvase
MKLSQWAIKQGITYKTAWNWFKKDKMPVKTVKYPSGAIMVIGEELDYDEKIAEKTIKNRPRK